MGGGGGCRGQVGDGGQAGFGGSGQLGVDVRGAGVADALPGFERLLERFGLDQGEEFGECEPERAADLQLAERRVGDHDEQAVERVGVVCWCDHAGIVAGRRGVVGGKVWTTTIQRTNDAIESV